MKAFTINKTLCAAIATGVLFTGAAQAAGYPAEKENDLVNICKAIKADNPMRLHLAVKRSGLNYRTLDEGLVCNGQNMMTFAATHSAGNSGKFLAARLHQSDRTLTAKR
ncbi:DUF3718 domain-containing protein [Alteromonas sp. H39]|uniref:DUF3718 domain-containing protein n=1 Tax=Alteromonas sp. H39 TaxID=3389876 RepID=UPI0039DFED8B